jgi:hypothetical protein
VSNEESALGLRLGEAIRRYSDEQKWRAYEDAAAAAAGKRRRGIIVLNGESIAGAHAAHRVHADNVLVDRKGKAWHNLLADFTRRLQSGELMATGLFAPLDARSQRQAIRAELWAVLKLNFSRSSAKGAGCEVVAIRVVHSAEQGGVKAADSTGGVFGDGLVGRPSCMAAIEAEMKARAERGELSETLTEECRQLAEWAKNAFRPRRTPTWKTIRNQLSSVYRQLKSPKKARN